MVRVVVGFALCFGLDYDRVFFNWRGFCFYRIIVRVSIMMVVCIWCTVLFGIQSGGV